MFSIEFSHLCKALAEQIVFGGTPGSEKQWKLGQWVCICLDVVRYNQAALHEQTGATLIFDLGPDPVYHCKMLQDCWLECRAAIGCAAPRPSCLRVRMLEDVYLFPFLFILFLFFFSSLSIQNTYSYIMWLEHFSGSLALHLNISHLTENMDTMMQPWLLAASFIPPFQAEFGTIQRPNAWIVEILAPQTKDEECLEWVNEALAADYSHLSIYPTYL